jgi:lysophospholipase L1-like esterase
MTALSTPYPVSFHNVGELERLGDLPGVLLSRFPRQVREALNRRARHVALEGVGCEVRFVCDHPDVRVFVAAQKPEFGEQLEIRVFRGDFEHSIHQVPPGQTAVLSLAEPTTFGAPEPSQLRQGFAPNVWRVQFGRGPGLFLGLDGLGGTIRPPTPEELPKACWLAYGSSITNSHLDGYPQVAARRLGVDVMNKGLSGACHCEPEVADWLATDCPWDFATLELGINMRGMLPERFAELAGYLVRKVVGENPGKPIFLIPIFPNCLSPGIAKEDQVSGNEVAFNQILRDLAAEIASPDLHLIEGDQILDQFTGLRTDLLHPAPYGHAVMGLNLAEILRPVLTAKGLLC